MYEFADIGVCDDASNTGMGGYNDYFFLFVAIFFFSPSIFHIYVLRAKEEGSVIFFFPFIRQREAKCFIDLKGLNTFFSQGFSRDMIFFLSNFFFKQ